MFARGSARAPPPPNPNSLATPATSADRTSGRQNSARSLPRPTRKRGEKKKTLISFTAQFLRYTKCDNLITGMAAACRWGLQQTHVPRHVWRYTNSGSNEIQTKRVVRSQAADEVVPVGGILWTER
jgi:hypothetical protein